MAAMAVIRHFGRPLGPEFNKWDGYVAAMAVIDSIGTTKGLFLTNPGGVFNSEGYTKKSFCQILVTPSTLKATPRKASARSWWRLQL